MNSTESLSITPLPDLEETTGGWRYHVVSVLLLVVEVQYKALMLVLLAVVGCIRLGCLPIRFLSRSFS